MPIHMERIENNFILQDKIKDCLIENQQTVFEYMKDDDNPLDAVISDDFNKISELILEKITEFVNQNYTFKGI